MPGWLARLPHVTLETAQNDRRRYRWSRCRHGGETAFLMRINRRFLNPGVFLVALGSVLVVADLNLVDAAILTDAARLWPLAIVAIGAGIVLRRTKFSLGGGMVAAALPGLVLGGAFTALPRLPTDCASLADAAPIVTEQGTFSSSASVSLTTSCGALTVTTAAGDAWSFEASSTVNRQPVIEATAASLSIDTGAHDGWPPIDAGRSAWNLTIPTRELSELELATFTGQSHVDLTDANIRRLALTANAADVTLDASRAAIDELSVVINVGAVAIDLPASSDLTGSLRVGGGELKVCAPPELGLRVTARGQPREVTVEDVDDDVADWQSENYVSATHRADLRVSANFGAVKINPIGGCK